MSIVLGDIDHRLEHQNRKGYSWNPTDETDNVEDGEYGEDDRCAVPMSHEVYDRRTNPKSDLEDTGDPDGSAINQLKQ